MRYSCVLILMVTVMVASCKKDKGTIEPVLPPPPPAPSYQLKDIVIPNLPSPYYHFEYNDAGKVVSTSFASDLEVTAIIYNADRIIEIQNNRLLDADKLKYLYDNLGRVSEIDYVNSHGEIDKKVKLFYDVAKLIKLERQIKLGADLIVDKTMKFVYNADGNLFELTYQYAEVAGQPAVTYTDRFEQYDNKINVDGFSLLHNDFFDHFFILPGVQLQKNNPMKETRTGQVDNYVVNYTYNYNSDNLPLSKTGQLTFTTGPDTGRDFQINSVFSYY